jgi:hypothetical protein
MPCASTSVSSRGKPLKSGFRMVTHDDKVFRMFLAALQGWFGWLLSACRKTGV